MPISTAPAEKWSDLAALLGDCLVVHVGEEGKRLRLSWIVPEVRKSLPFGQI
jgi:hypothetical protein